MARLPKSNSEDVRKGAWGADEDEKLRKYVETYGTGHWRSVGKKAGLQRCGKSCRLRWTNYLRPDILHGSFSVEEEELIIKLHASHGSRWSLIAAQLPGRTDNDIKNHWNTRLKKKLCDMGIDPVTHQPIADLLRDLAGSMARSGSAGNQDAEDAGRRWFRDNMLNKAVRECGRPPAVPSFFASQASGRNVVQRSGNPAISVAGYPRGQDTSSTSVARRFEKSAHAANSAHSLDDSSSTEESLSGRSSSPPLYMGLKHSATLPRRPPFISLQESSAAGHSHQEDAAAAIPGGREVIYPPSPLPLRLPEGLTPPSNFIQDLATCPPQSTLQIFPPDSDAFRRSPDSCDDALRGMIASSSNPYPAPRRMQFEAPSSSQPQARLWFSSRPENISHDQTQFQSQITRFSSSSNINLQQEPAQINHAGDDAVSYLQAGPNGVSTVLASFRDRDGHLIAPIEAAAVQENMGYRSLNMNLDGGVPLSNSSPSVGPAGPYHDNILQVNNIDAAGQFSNSANVTVSSNMITSFAPNSGPLAGAPRGTTTGVRLHAYEVVIPSPQVALWDY